MDSLAPVQVDDTAPALGWSRLVLRGRVTVAVAGEFRRAALDLRGRGQSVTVDCSAAEYLDTSAVQILTALSRELERGGHSCDIAGACPALRQDLRLAGFGGAGPAL